MVPLDGSENAEQALPVAASLSVRDGSVLHLITVEEPHSFILKDDPALAELLRRSEEAYLDEHAMRLRHAGARTTTAVLEGPVMPAIREYVHANAVDLVVMTTHGRTGVSRVWLGSIADGVMRHTTIPVLMLRPDTRGEATREHILFHRIFIPLDGSELAEQVIAPAIRLGGIVGTRYVLVRVVEPVPFVDLTNLYTYPTALVSDEDATREVQQAAERQIEALARSLREQHAGLEVDTDVVVAAPVAERLLESARAHAADLIALATHGRGMSRLAFGSIADKLIRGSPTPLLMYRPEMR
ncbi:MAG TPA: universal stress protein [Candidatus Elarobacter sp.]|nr:universal stress protein [Candidatus Elarobacter sp.]